MKFMSYKKPRYDTLHYTKYDEGHYMSELCKLCGMPNGQHGVFDDCMPEASVYEAVFYLDIPDKLNNNIKIL